MKTPEQIWSEVESSKQDVVYSQNNLDANKDLDFSHADFEFLKHILTELKQRFRFFSCRLGDIKQ